MRAVLWDTLEKSLSGNMGIAGNVCFLFREKSHEKKQRRAAFFRSITMSDYSIA